MNELYDGLFLMVVGMGTVFVFLILLILATNAIYKLCGDEPQTAAPTAVAQSQTDDATLIAVITAAITRHRNRTGDD